MQLDALQRLLRNGEIISGLHLAIEPGYRDHVVRQLKDLPKVATVNDRHTAIAILPGFLPGILLIMYILEGVDSDLYRIPLYIESQTYAFAASGILLATLVSSAVVMRQLWRLDLIAALKTRESWQPF